MRRRDYGVALGLSALSGLLLSVTMPGYFNLGILGWVALTPMLLAIERFPDINPRLLTLPFALIWTAAVHHWYASVFGSLFGYMMLVGAGAWYSPVLTFGIKLQNDKILPHKS